MKLRTILLIIGASLLISGCGILIPKPFTRAIYKDGYWDQWYDISGSGYYGRPNDFVLYNSHPADFFCKVTISNYNENRLNNKQFAVFNGYIEYHDTVEKDSDVGRSRRYIDHFGSSSYAYGNLIKRPAEIRVLKRWNGYVYNVFFDGVGIGLTIPW